MHKQTNAVPISEAARRAGVSPQLIARRVHSGQLRTIAEPRDLRVRLVDLDDLARLFGEEVVATEDAGM